MPPIADAGEDISVNADDKVTLDGSKSVDPDGSDSDSLTYSWKQVKGPIVDIYEADTATPSFRAPQVKDNDGNDTTALVLELTVTDADDAEDTDTIEVSVNDSVDQK